MAVNPFENSKKLPTLIQLSINKNVFSNVNEFIDNVNANF